MAHLRRREIIGLLEKGHGLAEGLSVCSFWASFRARKQPLRLAHF